MVGMVRFGKHWRERTYTAIWARRPPLQVYKRTGQNEHEASEQAWCEQVEEEENLGLAWWGVIGVASGRLEVSLDLFWKLRGKR